MINVVLLLIGFGIALWSGVAGNLDQPLYMVPALLPLIAFIDFRGKWSRDTLWTPYIPVSTVTSTRVIARIGAAVAMAGYVLIGFKAVDTSLTCTMEGTCTQWWNTWVAPIAYLALVALAGLIYLGWAISAKTKQSEWDSLPVHDEDLDIERPSKPVGF